jgi:hypothetical protein
MHVGEAVGPAFVMGGRAHSRVVRVRDASVRYRVPLPESRQSP